MSQVDAIIHLYLIQLRNPWYKLNEIDLVCQNLYKQACLECPDDTDDPNYVWQKVYMFVFSYSIAKQASLLASELKQFLYDSSPSDRENGYKDDVTQFVDSLHQIVKQTASFK